MSSVSISLASLFDNDDTNPDPALLGFEQPELVTEGGEASTMSKVPLVGDVPPNMGYAPVFHRV